MASVPHSDKRIDAYIEKSADFAKPVLTELRSIVHDACPDVEEDIKWGFPHFLYNGKILCSMASFKQHCAFHIWHGSQVVDAKDNKSDEAMGQFGRITSTKDLPSNKIIIDYIKEAMKLRDSGATRFSSPKPKAGEKKEVVVPDYFTAVLKKNKKAQATFDGFAYSHRKEYVEWITDAKTDETRQRRIATALEWLAEGKSRNWKYEKR